MKTPHREFPPEAALLSVSIPEPHPASSVGTPSRSIFLCLLAKQPIQREGALNLGVEESSSIDSDDFSLRQPRAPMAQQSRRVSQLQGGDVTAKWEFVGGVLDQKSKEGTGDDAEMLEVDALIDAIFVRGELSPSVCRYKILILFLRVYFGGELVFYGISKSYF